MKNSLFKILQICLMMVCALETSLSMDRSHSEDSDSDQIIILPMDGVISQQLSHDLSFTPTYKEIMPHEDILNNPKIVTAEENVKKYIPKIKNSCGFCLGRAQCGMSCLPCDSRHPYHDSLGNGYGCIMAPLKWTSFIVAIITTGIMAAPDINLVPWPVPVALTVIFVLSLIPEYIDLFYCCAKAYGPGDFTESIDRGRLCLPGDACSCTSLFRYNFYRFGCCCCFNIKKKVPCFCDC